MLNEYPKQTIMTFKNTYLLLEDFERTRRTKLIRPQLKFKKGRLYKYEEKEERKP